MWCVIKERIDKRQFGAIKAVVPHFALVKMTNDWMPATDHWCLKNHAQIILLDYAKALDHINLNILMKTLSDLGIPNILC